MKQQKYSFNKNWDVNLYQKDNYNLDKTVLNKKTRSVRVKKNLHR